MIDALADRAEHLLVSLLVAVGAEFEVLGPLVVSLFSCRLCATVLALDALLRLVFVRVQAVFALVFLLILLVWVGEGSEALSELRPQAFVMARGVRGLAVQ